MKDIDRTQSDSPTFQNALFKERQRKILMSYATEDPKVGYIQGMNIILSGILYHVKDEIKTFAIFRNLILNVRNMYLHGTPPFLRRFQGVLQPYREGALATF